MASTFIFDANTDTPAKLAERKRRAKALLAAGTSGIASNVGEGLAQLGQALAGRFGMAAAERAESKNMAAARKLLAGIGAPGMRKPAAPGAAAAAPNVSPDLTSGIVSTAQALGIDPVDLGTAISYETAGTFDPMKAGPRTQWGQHKGLIQFGEPQAKEFGVDWSNPIGSQLGPDGAVARYLRKTGVKPGMGMMDIYSAINAGGVGRYGASDANNGGAPGTVADKVNKQMGGHRAKAQALLASVLNANTPASPQIVPASAPPPGAPMPEQPPAMPPQAPQMVPQPQVQPAAAPMAPQAPQGPMSAYQRQMRNSMDRGGAPEAVARQMQGAPRGGPSMMQGGILGDIFGGNRGNVEVAPAMAEGMDIPQDEGGDRLAKLQQAMFSPWVAEVPGAVEFLQREYEREYQRLNPEPVKLGDRLVDPTTGKVIYEAPKEKKPPIEVGGALVDPETFKPVYQAPAKPGYRVASPEEKKAAGIDPNMPVQISPDGKFEPISGQKEQAVPAGIQEYEYAKKQGFPGTFQDWEASKKGGMSLQVDPATGQVTFQQGNNIKPLTEAQSQDTVYATRAEGALKQFEPNAAAMTEITGSYGGSIPGIGNYLKSKEYQMAEQAGREFLAAVLRKDSGGAITKEEVDEYGGTYLPKPGDSPEVLAQKKLSRTRAVEALKAGMTPQAILAKEKALSASGGAPQAALEQGASGAEEWTIGPDGKPMRVK